MKYSPIILAAISLAASRAPAQQSYTFFDNGAVALLAITNQGVLEPSIPLYLNGVRVNDPGTGGADLFDIVEFYDRVPGTGSYPLTIADIIANGYNRPLVQRSDGTVSAFGTSVVTGPSFRPQFQPIDIIPEMTRADVTTGGADRIVVQGSGSYSGLATLVSRRRYPDPAVGSTIVFIDFTWTASQNITLAAAPGGRGNDAFRLVMFSSMLASSAQGIYDARYLAITDPQGRRRTIEVNDQARNTHLFPSPRPIAVGGSCALLKDNAGTWNAGSPSMELQVLSVSAAASQLGVQGYLAGTTDPNDDSLSVWVEWMNPPATITAGTVIQGTLRLTATPATDPGDLNHDSVLDCADIAILDSLLGVGIDDPTYDAYADLDTSGVIDGADRAILLSRLTSLPADWDHSGAVTSQDFFAFLASFFAGHADFNADGLTTSQDFFEFLVAFFEGCG